MQKISRFAHAIFGFGIFGPKKADGFEEILSREGGNGWRYVDNLTETGVCGEAGQIKLIFERELE